MAEGRRPKSEGRLKPESQKSAGRSGGDFTGVPRYSDFENSDFVRVSGFGFRIYARGSISISGRSKFAGQAGTAARPDDHTPKRAMATPTQGM